MSVSRNRARLVIGALVTVCLSAACHEFSTGPGSIVGRYALVSIDGHAPPSAAILTNGLVLQLLDGQITVNADSTFTDSTDAFAVSLDTTITFVARGTYARVGDSLVFTPIFSSPYSFGIRGDILLQSYFSHVLWYLQTR